MIRYYGQYILVISPHSPPPFRVKLTKVAHYLWLPFPVQVILGAPEVPAGQGAPEWGAGDSRNHGAEGATDPAVQGGVVPLVVRQVQGPVEEGAAAGGRQRQLVDRRVGVALRLQLTLGHTAPPTDR